MLKAVAYARYSSENQREESISAQISAIQNYCLQKGYTLVDTYIDEAKTATTDRRPAFQKMVQDSAKGLFNIIVVHKRDRIFRDRYDAAFYKRQLKKNGVIIESVLEYLDDSPESIILESVLDGMAEYYSKNLAREVRKGMLENAKAGIHVGGRPPYGLRVNPETQKYEIDPDRYRAVQIYFESVAKGISLNKIAQILNELGYRTQEGRKFTKNSFDGWANNRKYIGEYTWDVSSSKNEDNRRNNHKNKPSEEWIVIPGAIPPIISKELFEKVNEMMKERRHKGAKMKAKVNYLLSGKVYCGHCEKPYNGCAFKSKDNYYTYYACNGKCGNRKIQKEYLEELVIKNLIETCFAPEAMRDIAQRVQELYQEKYNNIENELKPIKKELDNLNKQIDAWTYNLGKGIDNVLLPKIQEAINRKEALEYELKKALIVKAMPEIDEMKIIEVMENKKDLLFSDNDEDRKQIIQEFVDKVIVKHSDGGEFDITLNVRVFNGGGEGS
ncbi:recombinase family protein [Thermanaerosceptrum fracticalcis]|uniref:Recombinase family protein n=1 Tax=Thermanaerosceptrum fracticalcis TaxID=1712410 RepID=A0A7G6E447_THEFR|nr:recombinase family protein [Thermanaerosceptrum fracticalcis]QNB46851.1 recombinase family protein [Thermanaerosceptrum fracticalcis]